MYLTKSGEYPDDTKYEENTVPQPEHSKHLVIDNVETEDTDGILCLLSTRQPGVPGVTAGGNLGEHLTHRVSCVVQCPLFYW